jgi:hypothetical protein
LLGAGQGLPHGLLSAVRDPGLTSTLLGQLAIQWPSIRSETKPAGNGPLSCKISALLVPSHWTWIGDTSLTCGGPDWLGRLVSLNLAPERHSLSSVSFNLASGGRSLGDVSGLHLAQPWFTLRPVST